jgi:hypothetical protein
MPSLDQFGALDGLRAALRSTSYEVDAIGDLLGASAYAALQRNETTPGLRRTTDGSPLSTMVRLWLLQAEVEVDAVERALPGLLGALAEAGFLEVSGGAVRALLDVRPYADDDRDFWVVSDLTPGLDGAGSDVGEEYVLGISPASTSLAQLTIRRPVGSALDLGTGCGVQALHLASHAERVVATDVNPRALAIARLNAELNQVDYEVRDGSLFEPVAGERFDLIVTNPPFVVSPATGERLVYRDSGLPGDEVVRRVVTGAPAHLTAGGWCQVLTNWVHVEGQPWQERIEGWLAGSGCEAWVVQREVADPASYVELWLRDSGHDRRPDYRQRYDAWLGWLEEQRITGIGFGWINLHRTGSAGLIEDRLIEDWPHQVDQPIGPVVQAWGDRPRDLPEGRLLDRALRCRDDVRQETYGAPGAEDPEVIVLHQQAGMRRSRRVDTVDAALVGVCDGDLTVREALTAIATLVDRDAHELIAEREASVADLVMEGFLA